MWHYYLVQELIMNQEWIKQNGDNWIAGRVECHDSDNSYGYASREYSLIIDAKDWNNFDDYLLSISTESLQSLDQLIQFSKLPIVRFNHESEV
jgi:hypothetical protein